MRLALIYGFVVLTSLAGVALILGAALVARRLRLPILWVALAAGLVYGVGVQWMWGSGGSDAAFFYNFVPASAAARIESLANAHFREPGPHLDPTAPSSHAPWALQQPQLGILVSAVFWTLVAACAGTWVKRRARRT